MKQETRPAGLLMTFIACAFFMLSGGAANATVLPTWVADGYREVSVSNNVTVTYLPVKVEGFASETLCNDYINDQNALVEGTNIKGYAGSQRVVATCSQQK